MMRAATSVLPPVPAGTIRRRGFDGNTSAANAAPPCNARLVTAIASAPGAVIRFLLRASGGHFLLHLAHRLRELDAALTQKVHGRNGEQSGTDAHVIAHAVDRIVGEADGMAHVFAGGDAAPRHVVD